MFELNSIYLNSAYTGPMPVRAKKRVEEVLRTLLDPAFRNFEERSLIVGKVREKLGELLGAPAQNIALGGSVSEMVGHVANGLELHQGDNVILMDGDFPAMILPWMVVSELKGFHVHLLPKETFLQPELLEQQINDRTRFVGCSHVMFNTGIRLPVTEIAKVCRKNQVFFLADTSQSFGALRISPEIVKSVDMLVGVAYKWLLGPYGTAYAYFSDRALKEVRRTQGSWLASANSKNTEALLDYTTETLPGACRFDRGESPVYLLNEPLDAALEIMLEVGLEKIEKHNLALARHCLENLPKGFKALSADDTLSAIICFKPGTQDPADVKKRLAKNKIDISLREGHLRAAFHFFNTEEQVDLFLKALHV